MSKHELSHLISTENMPSINHGPYAASPVTKHARTYTIEIFVAGPIETAKQILRRECAYEGLCVTINPTDFIYSFGEEAGYVVTLRNYPRFPKECIDLEDRAMKIADMLIRETYQSSAMVVCQGTTHWISYRGEQ